ncbi:MAG: hypothetical protein AAF485_29995, partial [Chloroflexota bacterium]
FFFYFMDRGSKWWLFVSGLSLGTSFMFKILNPFLALIIGGLLLFYNTHHYQPFSRDWWKGLLQDGLLWSLGLLGPFIAVLLIYDMATFYDQVIAFRGDLRAAIPGSWAETWSHIQRFVETHWTFWILASGGIISMIWPVETHAKTNTPHIYTRFPRLYLLVWLSWLLLGLAMISWHTPLFQHHLIILLPPLILLGATFLADLTERCRLSLWESSSSTTKQGEIVSIKKLHGFRLYGVIMVSSLLIIVALLNVPALVQRNQETAAVVTGGRETDALKLLRAVSHPNDFIMGDSQLLIFMADRQTPPPLGDVALVAIKAGRQTSEKMISLTQRYQSPAVVQWSLRLPWLPDYLTWVDETYLARRVWDNDHIIYFVPRLREGQPIPNEQQVPIGQEILLRGFEVDETSIQAGQDVSLNIYWQTNQPLSEDYTVFTQLLDSGGLLAASWDSQPLSGYFPTSQWPSDEVITDVISLPLPAELPAGHYRLIAGMYQLETLERLKTPEGADHITLKTLIIE